MHTLNDTLAAEFLALAQTMEREGKLLSRSRLNECYSAFRERFGPEVLNNLDGESLLTTMHGRGDSDSLVYWLEFKSDDQFPDFFGSISGGSAYKFGVFYSKSEETWITGSPVKPERITVAQALEIARRQRDELVLGTQTIAEFAVSTKDRDYQQLQRDLEEIAPTVNKTAWGHKYFSLLFPDKLDDFHNPNYSRFHLIKALQLPPSGEGRYLMGGRFVAISEQTGLPINTVAAVMNTRDGRSPCTYWRIGTREGDSGPSRWDLMKSGNCIAIGWRELGDLTPLLQIPDESARKTEIKELVRTHYGKYGNQTESSLGNQAAQINTFLNSIAVNDLAVAMDGAQVLGIGRVTGPYRFQDGDSFPHQIPVDWLSQDPWQMSPPEQLRTTVRPIGKHLEHLVEIETRIYGKKPIVGTRQPPAAALDGKLPSAPFLPLPALVGIPARVQSILVRKSQVILYGPPGTGKTYWAEIAAQELAARSWFKQTYDALSEADRAAVTTQAVRLCSFHPAYGYEDFLEGFRPELAAGQMTFQRRDGVFKRLCAEAEASPDRAFYLIIDEINRGDIPRIFGELLTVLEKDKRGKAILLPLSDTPFRVPPNVFLIGTMNTADRSIALIDAALRRRFGFIELLPDISLFANVAIGGLPLRLWLEALNKSIVAHVGRDGRNLQVGHSYFLVNNHPVTDKATFARILEEDIVPLLQEYCYEDFTVLEAILGSGLVDTQSQTIRSELFERDRYDDLVTALIAPHPELATAVTVQNDSDEGDLTDPDEPEAEDTSEFHDA